MYIFFSSVEICAEEQNQTSDARTGERKRSLQIPGYIHDGMCFWTYFQKCRGSKSVDRRPQSVFLDCFALTGIFRLNGGKKLFFFSSCDQTPTTCQVIRQWGTVNAKIKVHSAENPDLSKISSVQPDISQNRALWVVVFFFFGGGRMVGHLPPACAFFFFFS